MVTLHFDVGSEHGIAPNHIISALTEGGRVRRADIGRIHINTDNSEVSLPAEGAKAMLKLEAPIVKDFVVTIRCDGMEGENTDAPAASKKRRRRRRKKPAQRAQGIESAPESPAEE